MVPNATAKKTGKMATGKMGKATGAGKIGKGAGAAKTNITQKMAIQRLNKARATLQKAVQAVNMANKKLASTMPASPKKKAAAQPTSRRNSE